MDQYAKLMYIGTPSGDPAIDAKQEYWIGFNGHAFSQPLSGLLIGTLGLSDGTKYQGV